jgi:hypothetical protein
VDRYSTNPIEKVVMYSTDMKIPGLSVLKKVLKQLENIQEFVQSIQFECDQVVPPHVRPPNTVLMNTSQGTMNKKLKNLLTDVIFHIEMLGMFGGRGMFSHVATLLRNVVSRDWTSSSIRSGLQLLLSKVAVSPRI